MSIVRAVNVGKAIEVESKSGRSGIDKRPVDGAVLVTAPGAGGSGLAGDEIIDGRVHGGPVQAVYAYAREDLDRWQTELGVVLADGVFGENLTTVGIDITGTKVGELWRVGEELVLRVTTPRMPCRTFAAWLDREGWVKTFTQHAVPGTYLSVEEPGHVRAGDRVTVLERPGHGVTVGMAFRAVTLEPELLPGIDVDGVHEELRATARKRISA
ncbi:MOSC domain-containing protein [Actinokineospora pegani]|uniref:MOSC domain-containing protein n=1 Tax=Actinokineospora pegani TaxID=2654637 RepID=UPI0012E9F247|nr:MOSC domain-containing protein [Actinokineospora pegani]